MPKINCSVDSCFYNQEAICGAHILNIGGQNAHITENTCCQTYKAGSAHNNTTLSQSNRGDTDLIFCEVNTCSYYAKNRCMLGEIEIGSLQEVEHYAQTDCLSFERR